MEDARDLVRIFLEAFDVTLAGLTACSPEERRRAAHSMKSSARIVGLMTLSHQMAELEERLAKQAGDVTSTDVAVARENFEASAPALRAFAAPFTAS